MPVLRNRIAMEGVEGRPVLRSEIAKEGGETGTERHELSGLEIRSCRFAAKFSVYRVFATHVIIIGPL